jgi:hypothetical protein
MLLQVSVVPVRASAAKVSVLLRRTVWTSRETTLRQRQELAAEDRNRMTVGA